MACGPATSELLEELGGIEIVGTATAQEAGKWMDGHTQACDVALVDNFDSGSGLAVLKHASGYRFPPERVPYRSRRRCKHLSSSLRYWVRQATVADSGLVSIAWQI